MKKLCLFILAAVLGGQSVVTPVSLADVAGDGAVHAVAATGTAYSVTITSASSNSTTNCGSTAISGCVRTGDSNISTSRGQYLTPGQSAEWKPQQQRYNLSSIYYLVQSGDKISISMTQ